MILFSLQSASTIVTIAIFDAATSFQSQLQPSLSTSSLVMGIICAAAYQYGVRLGTGWPWGPAVSSLPNASATEEWLAWHHVEGRLWMVFVKRDGSIALTALPIMPHCYNSSNIQPHGSERNILVQRSAHQQLIFFSTQGWTGQQTLCEQQYGNINRPCTGPNCLCLLSRPFLSMPSSIIKLPSPGSHQRNNTWQSCGT